MIGAPGIEDYVDPFLTFVPASHPEDILFHDADLMPELRGDLFVSVLGFTPQGAQTLLRVRFEDPSDLRFPTTIERLYQAVDGNSVYGRLRGMTVGPYGAPYVGTSNLDGRPFTGSPRDGDDQILRISPAGTD